MDLLPRPLTLAFLLTTVAGAVGCDSGNDEYSQFVAQSLQQQAQQNERLVNQTQAVTDGARLLVSADSASRRDMLTAFTELARQHEELERERRELAAQRRSDPILAAAIDSFGSSLACLLPLLLAIYVVQISTKVTPAANDAIVAEYLVADFTTHCAGLLGQSSAPPKLGDSATTH